LAVFLWFVWKRKINLLKITSFFAIASFIFNVKGISHDMVATFYSPLTRFWELLCGSLLALATLKNNNYFNNNKHKINYYLSYIIYRENQDADGAILSNIFSFVGLLLLMYGFWRINKELSFPGNWALVPVLGALLIINAGSKAWVNRTILSNKIAVWFGLISFPLYLWHWPILSFARILESEVISLNIRIAAVFLSIVLAWLTYELVEHPLRFGKSGRKKVTALVVLMTIVGVFSYYSYRTNLIPSGAVKTLSVSKQIGWYLPVGSPEQSNLCHQAFPERALMTSKERDDNFCLLQKKGIPNVVLIGDSINLSFFPGLTKYSDHNILVLSASAAAPFFNVRTTEYGDSIRLNNYKLTNQALEYAINNENIKVVVLGSIASTSLVLSKSDFKITDVLNPNNEDAHNIFTSSLRLTITKLLQSGKEVIYALPNPILSYDIKSCLGNIRPILIPGYIPKSCSQPVGVFFQTQGGEIYKEWVMSVLKEFPQVKVFDASFLFCDSDYCYGSKDGNILYRDNVHLSINGSSLVAPRLHDLIIDSLNR